MCLSAGSPPEIDSSVHLKVCQMISKYIEQVVFFPHCSNLVLLHYFIFWDTLRQHVLAISRDSSREELVRCKQGGNAIYAKTSIFRSSPSIQRPPVLDIWINWYIYPLIHLACGIHFTYTYLLLVYFEQKFTRERPSIEINLLVWRSRMIYWRMCATYEQLLL